MFRALLCSSAGGQLYYHSIWYRQSLWVTGQYTRYESSRNLCTEQAKLQQKKKENLKWTPKD